MPCAFYQLRGCIMPTTANNTAKNFKNRPLPPGRIKIAQSLKSLLVEKEFSAITTAEIAKNAGVTEALIYKYFNCIIFCNLNTNSIIKDNKV